MKKQPSDLKPKSPEEHLWASLENFWNFSKPSHQRRQSTRRSEPSERRLVVGIWENPDFLESAKEQQIEKREKWRGTKREKGEK